MASVELGEKVSRRHFIVRKAYQKLSGLLLPTDLKPEDGGEGIERARSLLREGLGFVIIYTHPSRTDTYRLMELWQYDEFAERRCLIPIAYHQFNRWVTTSAWPTGTEFYPIVTEETVNRKKNNGLSEGYGSRRFLNNAVEALSQGGTVLLAPSMTRTAQLKLPEKLRPTDMLLNGAHMRRVPFAVLFTGFEINSVTSYESARGINLFRKYTLHTSSTLTDSEILKKLVNFREDNGLDLKRPFNGTDEWLYQTQLPSLVSPAYHPKS